MELKLRLANEADAEYIYQASGELLSSVLYTRQQFYQYYQELMSNKFGKCELWVCEFKGVSVGYIEANVFPIVRYMGFGVELEEVVILPKYRNKGIGKAFIELIKAHYAKDANCRKLMVKTNDLEGSGKLYADVIGVSDMKVYQQLINRI